MKVQINKIRFSCFVLAFGGMISGWILPASLSRAVRAEEEEVSRSTKAVPSVEQVGKHTAKQSVEFEENRGQLDKRVRYQARGSGYSLFLTADEAVYVLPMPSADGEKERKGDGEIGTSESAIQNPQPEMRNQTMFALRMKIVGANSDSLYRGEEVREHRTNYFRGDNSENWQTDVPNYSRVRMGEVYPGVSMVWHGREQSATQYDFVVEPDGDASQIGLEFDGAESIEIDAEGDLLIRTEAGTIKQTRPFTYQETDGVRAEVESHFVLSEPSAAADGKTSNPQIRFSLGEYDRSKPLTIDPYSTFMGGSGDDRGHSIAVDQSGNVYVTGWTQSTNYPTTAGVFDTTYNGEIDVFVTKLNAAGSAPIYSTYLGGSSPGNSGEVGESIAVDSSGNAYITGWTSSINFPTTAGAFDTTFNGGDDVFVTKLNATGSALIYSTFIGGSVGEYGIGIAVDSSGNAYLTGQTLSTDYPTTAGAFDTTYNGGGDGFATKLNADGSALNYSTFLGGSLADNNEASVDIAIDSSGNVYLTGNTYSTNFPTTAGAFDTTHNSDQDVFVTKLNAVGSNLIYSTYIGGSGGDRGFDIAVDSSENAYITGDTFSSNYPTTAGAFDTSYNNNTDVFVTKLNAAGSALIYSTYIGGSDSDYGKGVAVDTSGNAFVTGTTYGFNTTVAYPTTAGAFDTTHNGVSDVFVTSLTADGSALIYSTFIGGNNTDIGNGIALDSSGNVIVTGQATSANYPTTAGAFDTTYNGGSYDVLVTSLGFSPTAASASVSGRVTTSQGQGIINVRVSLTDQCGNVQTAVTGSFGYYRFDDINAGQTVVISVASKRYSFANPNRILSVEDELAGIDFTAESQ